jgi:hypothetical protein
MPDTPCCEVDVTVDGQERVPVRGTPQRLQAADVPRPAEFERLVPLCDVIAQPVPKALEAANSQ